MTTLTDLSPCDLMRDELRSLLKLDTPPQPDQPLAGLGLTSLIAVTLQYRLQTEHGITLSLDDLMGQRSINDLLAPKES